MNTTKHDRPGAVAGQVDCRVRPHAELVKRLRNAGCDGTVPCWDATEAAAAIERLSALLRRALPMADALDATKTAVVWTGDMQADASMLAREIRAALGPNG